MAKDSRPTVWVRMKQSTSGSADGKHVKVYSAGEKYHVPQHLADIFLEMGACELVSNAKLEVAAEEPAPEKAAEEAAETADEAPEEKAVEEKPKTKKKATRKKKG